MQIAASTERNGDVDKGRRAARGRQRDFLWKSRAVRNIHAFLSSSNKLLLSRSIKGSLETLPYREPPGVEPHESQKSLVSAAVPRSHRKSRALSLERSRHLRRSTRGFSVRSGVPDSSYF